MTINDLREMSNNELIKFVNSCKGHTGNDPNKPETYFQTFAKTDFSYSAVVSELTKRGAKNGWYFDECEYDHANADSEISATNDSTEFITVTASNNDILKKTFRINRDVAGKWDETFKAIPSKSFLVNLALQRFADDYKNGKFRFVY